MQTDINHYLTKDKINQASFSQKLDTISKSIIRWQNPVELVFKDISTYNVENPIVASLVRGPDVGKKYVAGDLVEIAPRQPGLDTTLRNGLNRLKDRPEPKDGNNDLSPTPSSSPQPPPSFSQRASTRLPPPSGRFLEPFQPPQGALRPSNFIGISPAPSAPPLVPENTYILASASRTPSNNLYDLQTQTLTRKREKVKDAAQKELDDKIYELPDDPPKLELRVGLLLGTGLLGTEAEDILVF